MLDARLLRAELSDEVVNRHGHLLPNLIQKQNDGNLNGGGRYILNSRQSPGPEEQNDREGNRREGKDGRRGKSRGRGRGRRKERTNGSPRTQTDGEWNGGEQNRHNQHNNIRSQDPTNKDPSTDKPANGPNTETLSTSASTDSDRTLVLGNKTVDGARPAPTPSDDFPKVTTTSSGFSTSSPGSQESQQSLGHDLDEAGSSNRLNVAAIAGGVLGGLVFLSLLVLAFLFLRRRRLKRRIAPSAEFMQRYANAFATPAGTDAGSPPPYTQGSFTSPYPFLKKP
ncbi:hypothetical protein FA15DRAFT_379908 [Coprinopsis marcescibilis]|uniref:Uncharacterized protein n=1 Tax=Coprinopsis marcescibilis TaxID=230819 RepID=A0A5C3KXQ5_COPMA|nr:hypothetical protein FA15DRAFT_379908 [Coprinopsis marcescibilis]